ncbi:MAG TPA: TonB family protein, partial [Thermoanaerobaculia bacterium]|nr:TonB family protein [Thermoanaerobaculia bacterium]
AMTQSATDARAIVPLLTGTSFVKEQAIDIASGIPFVAHEYAGGRSLRHVVDRARGGSGVTANPIPIDQAILIAEKVALSLATTAELRYGGNRLAHGALIPQFIWITDDGEARVAGQQLGKGLIASLKDSKVAANIARYFSPEYQHSGEATQASEVYSMGAIFFLLITGNEPPDAAHVSAFAQAVRAGKTMDGQPIPDDIRSILEKSLVIDASRRFVSIGDMKQALSTLAHGGKYAPTTFNLAFYLSNLLKKEMEGEAIDREKESKVNIAPYLEQHPEIAPPPLVKAAARPSMSKAVLYGAAAVMAVAIAGLALWLTKASTETAKAQIASANTKPAIPPAKPAIAPPPVAPESAAAPTETIDPAAQKKAFEQAVSQKLQEEMSKLQSQFNKEQQKKSAPAPVALTASVAPQRSPQVIDDRAPSAAALDERRLAARQETTTQQQPIPVPVPVTQTQAAPVQPQPQPVVAEAAPAPTVREGDLVDYDKVDVRPQPINKPVLRYPPMAMRTRAQASLILTVLVSETGEVLDVKILRGDPRFGFNDEAVRMLRGTRFRPAMKEGKPVKTWIPQPIDFKIQ